MTTHNNSQILFTQHTPKSMIAYNLIAKSKRRLQSAVLLLSWVIITGCNNTTIDADGSMQTPSTNALSNSVKITPTSYRDMIEKKRESRFTEQKIQAIDRALALTAEQIAEHLANKSFVADLHQEVLAKFDNQTEVLLSKVVQGSAKKNFSKKNPFDEIYSQELKSIEQDVNAPIHLYWYNAEQWDKTTTPIIAFVKCKEHKNKQAVLDGFSSDGRKIKVSEGLAKKQPVIIVNFNERVKVDPKKVNIELPPLSVYSDQKSNASITMSPITIELANISVHGQRTDFEGWFDNGPEFYYIGWEQNSAGNWRIYTDIGSYGGRNRFMPNYFMGTKLNSLGAIEPDGPYSMEINSYYTWMPLQSPTAYLGWPFGSYNVWNDRGQIVTQNGILWLDFYEEDTFSDDYLENHQIPSSVINGQVFKQNSRIEGQYRVTR